METCEPLKVPLDPEAEFLASKQETGNEWELFKENVRPLKRGRQIHVLNHALKANSSSKIKNDLIQHRRKLIEAIDQYEGDDPLQPWIQCIKWVQEAFPPGGDSSGLVLMYEQCLRTFWHQDRYKDDPRYLNVWLDYAENCNDSEVIFEFMEANKIGVTHASFYISFALHLERKNKSKTANEIFYRGLSMNAHPVEKLEANYKKFMIRAMRLPQATDDDATESQLPSRSFGTELAKGARNQIAESHHDLSRKKLKPDRVSGCKLSIFKENGSSSFHQSENVQVDIKPFHLLGARAERNKENNQIPSKWTSNKIPQKNYERILRTPPGPCIEIFVDEDSSKQQKENNGERKLSMPLLSHVDDRDVKKETELLRENPLRNFPPASMPR